MSHGKERKDKNCLNCGTIVQGRFCQHCGQENIEPNETFWQMMAHFFNDITHFDGKFLPTLSYLVAKPGFLPLEYIRGRRARYLHPVRMYVFSSALFFLIFFAYGFKPDFSKIQRGDANSSFPDTNVQLGNMPKPVDPDSMIKARAGSEGKIVVDSMKAKDTIDTDTLRGSFGNSYADRKAKQYVDAYKAGKGKEMLSSFVNSLAHKMPYALMISLPFFAMILYLLYRRKQKVLYINHAIFSIHFYVYQFVTFLFSIITFKVYQNTHLGIFLFLFYFTIFLTLFYLLFAMKNFYGQGWIKTFIKYCIVLFLSFFLFSFIIAAFTLIEAFIFNPQAV